MSKKQLPFFVYGTLRIGQPNHHIIEKAVERSMQNVVLNYHHLIGRQNAPFPFMVASEQIPHGFADMADDSGIDGVCGDLLWIEEEDYDRVLEILDSLEAVPWMYTREIVGVEYGVGDDISAWAYRASREVVNNLLRNPFIPDNDWNQYVEAQAKQRK